MVVCGEPGRFAKRCFVEATLVLRGWRHDRAISLWRKQSAGGTVWARTFGTESGRATAVGRSTAAQSLCPCDYSACLIRHSVDVLCHLLDDDGSMGRRESA